MAKRTSIGNSRRFEIFKRDSFACQYCGRTPPAAILEVDHVIAVSKGGTNDDENLLTSCFECNHGKAARDLGDAAAPVDYRARLIEKRERAQQAAAYNLFLLELRDAETAAIERIGEAWYDGLAGKPAGFLFGPSRQPSVRRFLKELPEMIVLEAVEIAQSWHGARYCSVDRDDKAWRYFCGICWRKIKQARGEDV